MLLCLFGLALLQGNTRRRLLRRCAPELGSDVVIRVRDVVAFLGHLADKLLFLLVDPVFFLRSQRVSSSGDVLSRHKVVIGALQFQELVMRALLDDAAGRHDDNVVCIPNGRQAMSNGDSRTTGSGSLQSSLDDTFRLGVESGGCLVEEQNLGVGDNGTRNSDALLLATR